MRMGRSPPFHPRFAVTVAACPGLSRASPPTILDTFLPRPTYRIYIRWLDEITSHLLNAPCRPFLNNWRQLSPVSIGNGSKCWSDCLLLISDACWSHRLRVTMACGSDCGISGHLYQFSGQFPHYRFHYQSFSTGIYIYIYIYMRVFWKPFWTIYDTTRSITIYLELNFFSRESCSCIYHYWWTISSVLTSSWYHFVHFHHPQLISGGLDIFLLSLLLFLLLGDQNESGMMLIRLLCDSDLWIAGDDAEPRLRAAN